MIRFLDSAFAIIITMYNKTVMRFGKYLGQCYQLKPKAEADKIYRSETLIIWDITKTKSISSVVVVVLNSKLTSSEIPFMVSRVSVNIMALCMVSAVIGVGVVPDSKASDLVSRW